MKITTIDQLLDKLKANGHEVTLYQGWLQRYRDAVNDVSMNRVRNDSLTEFEDALARKSRCYYYLWGVADMAYTFGLIGQTEVSLILDNL